MSGMDRADGGRDRRWAVLIGGLVLLGLVLRVYKAWTLQFAPDADHGIVQLMAKHMAEGRDFPVFFYGQPYMGSLEPAISAVICKGFGVSAFHICLGTVLAGIALLPLLYVWGREAGGRRAGLVALVLGVVGSNTNFHFSVAPRGGYMAMMTCGVGVVYVACRIVTRLKSGHPVGLSRYGLLGLLAGLGWWSNQLVVVFLLCALVILLLGVSWPMIRRGTLPALLAFLAGSAPWWVWNATHGWSTFDFGEALGRLPPGRGLLALGHAFLRATDLVTPRSIWSTAVLGLMLVAVAAFVLLLIRDIIRREAPGQVYYRLAAPLTVLCMVAVSMTSKYMDGGGTGRYLLPLLPPLAVMLGCVVARFLEGRLVWLGWILTVILIPAHLYSLPRLMADYDFGRQSRARVEPVVQAAGSVGDGVCYGEYSLHWLNFASDERLCVATVPWERYAPYGLRAELAVHPVVLDNYNGLHAFLAYSGGHGQETNVAGVHMDYHLTPPPNEWRYVEDRLITAIRDDKGVSRRMALTDSTMNTGWAVFLRTDERVGPRQSLILELGEPRPLCGIRFVSRAGQPPGYLQIEGHAAGGTNWVELLPWTAPGGYFWSGSYLKLEGLQTCEEIRFTVPEGGVDRLRIRFGLADSRPRDISLDELLVLEKAPAPDAVDPSVEDCLSLLRQEGVRQFKGPRWMTERLAVRDTGDIKVTIPAFVSRSVQSLPGLDSSQAAKFDFRETTGLLMDARDVPRTRTLLAKCGQQWEERSLGSLILMLVAPATDEDDAIRRTPLYWTEQGCFAEDRPRTVKSRADVVYREALAALNRGATNAVISRLGKALSLYEGHQPARRALAEALRGVGMTNEACFQDAILTQQTRPEIPGVATFSDGIQLLGITLSTNSLGVGQTVDVTYFWSCPTGCTTRAKAVFVNFQGARGRFQDDHVFMEDLMPENVAFQVEGEVLSYTHRITIPASVAPGLYSLNLGMVERVGNTRIKPATCLTVYKRGVVLPVKLHIVPRDTP